MTVGSSVDLVRASGFHCLKSADKITATVMDKTYSFLSTDWSGFTTEKKQC